MSNFGNSAARYAGTALLHRFGGVDKPHYEHLTQFILLRTLMRLLPLLLVPFLVPKGTPQNTAAAMGAGAGVTAAEDDEGEGVSLATVSPQLSAEEIAERSLKVFDEGEEVGEEKEPA